MKIKSLLTVAFLSVAPVFATSINLPFNTGVDNSGHVLFAGTLDTHNLSGTSEYTGTTDPYGAWIGPDCTSAWVMPDTGNGSSYGAGYYTTDYKVSFNLTGFNPASVKLTGILAVDNNLNNIFVNGTSTGITAASYGNWTDFTLTSGFVSGLNTIDFNYTNTGGPGGIRIDFTSANGTLAPEPANIALFGIGFVGLGLLRLKAKKTAARSETSKGL